MANIVIIGMILVTLTTINSPVHRKDLEKDYVVKDNQVIGIYK